MTGVDPHGARTPQDIPDISLAEFYLARLDDEARIARGAAARAASWSVWDEPGRSEILAGGKPIARMNEEYAASYDAEHIARHDPARVLRDVAAKRQIVGLLHHKPEVGIRAGTDHYVSCACGWEQVIPNGLDWDFPYLEHLSVRHVSADPTVANAVLRLLAEVYADHPDYRSEWRP